LSLEFVESGGNYQSGVEPPHSKDYADLIYAHASFNWLGEGFCEVVKAGRKMAMTIERHRHSV
jgi:hypothetical protein